MYWSTIVVHGLRRRVTANQVAKATGYNRGCVEIHRCGAAWSAWIETTNHGREREKADEATRACDLAGLLAD